MTAFCICNHYTGWFQRCAAAADVTFIQSYVSLGALFAGIDAGGLYLASTLGCTGVDQVGIGVWRRM
jgi:hypothetical protein